MFVLLFGIGPTACCFSQSVQELEAKLKTCSAEEKPAVLNQLSEKYLSSDVKKSIDYAEQALKSSRSQEDINGEAGALVNLGNGYLASPLGMEQGATNKNQNKAIQYYKDAIAIYDKYNQPSGSAYLWNKIADSYSNVKKYSEAIDANLKAIDLFKKANEKNEIANVNIDIGDIFLEQKKYDNAISYYKQSLKVYEDAKDPRNHATTLNRIGVAYSNWGNYDEALIFLNRAIEVAKKNNLVSLSNDISKNLDIAKENMSKFKKSQTEFGQKKEQETQEALKSKEQQVSILSSEKAKTLEEIEQLSTEAQVKELKIKAQEDEIFRKKTEAETKTKENDLLKKQKELDDYVLQQQRLILFGVIGFTVLVITLAVFAFIAYRNKRKANNILKQKNDVIYKQKEQIEQKNTMITDSIDYAKNIQDAILPPTDMLSKYFPKSFIFYKPKDIVSGDFYWMLEINAAAGGSSSQLLSPLGATNSPLIYIAAADSTGHGVPGAFMSLLGMMLLFDAVKKDNASAPSEILKNVNIRLMDIMKQNKDNRFTGKFGMDIAMIKYDHVKKEIEYSGAQNPIILIRNKQINEIKGDKVSIGATADTSFTHHTLQVKEGDMIYIYSDGYQDQIGGERKKKFLSYHLKEFLMQIHTFEPEQQQAELEKKHTQWRSNIPQTDDILIMGMKI